MGTGIGGAFYNQTLGLYNGTRHRANEIGYLLYRSEDQLTFEQRASTTALKFLMKSKSFPYSDDVPMLFKLADQDNELALDILNEWSFNVAEGLAQIQIMYDPGLILIGGGFLLKIKLYLNISFLKFRISFHLNMVMPKLKRHTLRIMLHYLVQFHNFNN